MDEDDPEAQGDRDGGTRPEGTAQRQRQRQPDAERSCAHQPRVLQQRRRRALPSGYRCDREETPEHAHEGDESPIEIGRAHRCFLPARERFVGERVQRPVQDEGQCDDENRVVDQ